MIYLNITELAGFVTTVVTLLYRQCNIDSVGSAVEARARIRPVDKVDCIAACCGKLGNEQGNWVRPIGHALLSS